MKSTTNNTFTDLNTFTWQIVLAYPATLLKGFFLPKFLHRVGHILYKDVHLNDDDDDDDDDDNE